jgi:hypothetical protein
MHSKTGIFHNTIFFEGIAKLSVRSIFGRFCRDLVFDANSQILESGGGASNAKSRRKRPKAIDGSFAIPSFIKLFFFCCLISIPLFPENIDIFYGPVDIEEPVLLELIESPAFQRLKSIHQYGVAYYTTHREEYSRYDHSLGVFTILRAKNCSLEEQIAGLLHDVSHTVFSHVGDLIFGRPYQDKDYQTSILQHYIEKSGLQNILKKYNISPNQILPVEDSYPALEQKLPNLCADRIDYNIQGAYHQNFISYEEALELFEDLQFIRGNWVSTKPQLINKLVRFSLFMTETCWGSPDDYVASSALADAILEALNLGYVSYDVIHFGIDDAVWNALIHCKNPFIQEKMQMVTQANVYYCLVDQSEADFIVKSKFRGIDPWILSDEKLVRLTSIDETIAKEYIKTKKTIEKGWAIKYKKFN